MKTENTEKLLNAVFACCFSNEAETWQIDVRSGIRKVAPELWGSDAAGKRREREFTEVLDKSIRYNRKVRQMLVGQENLDQLTDVSSVITDTLLKVCKTAKEKKEFIDYLKAFRKDE